MPMWPGADSPALDRALAAHESSLGSPATRAADAPATWPLIGEHVDHAGGVVLMSQAPQRTAVALSPRSDDLIRVTHHRTSPEGTVTTADEISSGVISDLAAAQQTGVDEQGRPLTPPTPTGGLAARLGGIVWTMVNRQLLSRGTGGLDITVVSDIPDDIGLGADAALEAAFALALQSGSSTLDDAPLRARLAEVCSQATAMFSDNPPLRARHTAALRGTGTSIAAIDYADGSVNQIPHPATDSVRVLAVMAPGPTPSEHGQIHTRRRFLDDACRAFGTDSLRSLPDAAPRVLDWLRAVHRVHGTEDAPTIQEAAAWLSFTGQETIRAQQINRALRSRRADAIWPLLSESQDTLSGLYGLSTLGELTQLCLARGALTARAAAAGVSGTVIAFVDVRRATNFAADLSADGLTVVPLDEGGMSAARSHCPLAGPAHP